MVGESIFGVSKSDEVERDGTEWAHRLSYLCEYLSTYRVIIWECILNKRPARISIDRHSKTLYTVRTPKVGHFTCYTKIFDIWKGWRTELDQCGTPLCELTWLVSTSDVFGYSLQVNPCFWRKAYIVVYSCVLLLTCISCVSVNWEKGHWSQARRRLACRKTMVVLVVPKLMWPSNLERKKPIALRHAYLHCVPLNQFVE